MVVQHSVCIDRSIESVSAVIARDARAWFPSLESPDEVTVEVGEPITFGDWTEMPVRWQATFIKQLLPVMVGTVELVPVDGHVTKLTVCGRYQSLPRHLGRQLDNALMHTVAEANVKELAESIAKRLEAGTADAAGVPV